MRTPRDAFGNMGPYSNRQGHSVLYMGPSNASHATSSHMFRDVDKDSETDSDESFESALSLTERRVHQSAIDSCSGYDTIGESASSDDEKSESNLQRSHLNDCDSTGSLLSEPEKENSCLGTSSILGMESCKGKQPLSCLKHANINQLRSVPKAFWPHWVYRMYDSYCLAQKAAGSLNLLFLILL